MELFEDVVMKRIKEDNPSLEEKMNAAAGLQTTMAREEGDGRTKDEAPGR